MLYKTQNIIFVFICLLLVSCTSPNLSLKNTLETDKMLHEPHIQIKSSLKKKEPLEQNISVSAVGDILIHDRVYNDAKVGEGYDFNPMLSAVKPYLNDTTITFANQETMIGGTELGLSSYPAFNSPHEVGDALKNVGVNVVSLANNHTLDRGEEIIQHAIKHWEDIDMMYVGSYKDEADQKVVRVIETDEGITVAILAYTYGTNGIPIPQGKKYLVNLIDKDQISKDIKLANKEADVTMISLHFGNEYERMPSEEQKDLVQFVVDQGVHIVLGTHPHVLQPVEWVTGQAGNETLVVYSLGNFLSGQDELYRQIGGVLKFDIKKQIILGEEQISVHSPRFLTTYNASENESNYRVLPMHQVTEAILPNVRTYEKEMEDHMSQWMPQLEFIE